MTENNNSKKYKEVVYYKHSPQVREAMRILKAEYLERKRAKLTSCAQTVKEYKK